jgi:hypothetical protein
MKHLLLTTIGAVVLVGCGSVFVVHASGQNERSKAKAENVHMASSTLMATIKKDINYIYFILFIILTLIALAIYVLHKLDSARPFREAAKKGDIEAVRQNIFAEVNVNAIGGFFRRTALHFAAEEGHKEIVELLITHNADLNKKTSNGWAALHFAAEEGHKEVAELLIAKGADMNANSDDDGTPLDRAVSEGHKEISELLRKHGGKTGEELEAEGK